MDLLETENESGTEGLISSTIMVSEEAFDEMLRLLDEPPKFNPQIHKLWTTKSVLEKETDMHKKQWQITTECDLPGNVVLHENELYFFEDYDDADMIDLAYLKISVKDGQLTPMEGKHIRLWIHVLTILEPEEMEVYGGSVLTYSSQRWIGEFATEEEAAEKGRALCEGTDKHFKIVKSPRTIRQNFEKYPNYEIVEIPKKDV